MAKVSDLFPSKYLAATDLPNKDEDYVFTIRKVGVEPVGRENEEKSNKLVIYFDANELAESLGAPVAKKGMVLNKTNASMIASLYGEDYEQWPTNRVAIHVEHVTYLAKAVEALRVRGTRFTPKVTSDSFTQEDKPQFNPAYGIVLPENSTLVDNLDKLANIAEKTQALKAQPSEVVTIKALLREVYEEATRRKITWNVKFLPKNIGEAVEFLQALVNACTMVDYAAADSTPF